MRSALTITLVASILSLCAPRFTVAQGAGVVGTNGLEPVVEVTGLQVLAPSMLRVRDLNPVLAGSTAIVAISPESAHLDLTSIGLPGAALGIQLAPLSGPIAILSGLPISGTGDVVLPFTPPASLSGTTLYLQAMVADPGAPVGGIALSDAIAVTFGGSSDVVIASAGPSTTSQDLMTFSADGLTTGPVLPGLNGVSFLPMQLTASHDTLPLSTHVPVEDSSDPVRPRLLLPGGRALYHYARPGGASGYFVVSDHGRSFHWLIEAPMGFDVLVAASPFEPLVAVSANGPVSQFGNAELFLLRTDGSNFAGTPSPVHVVDLSGPLSGFNLKTKSLTFLNGALLFTDAVGLVRVPTNPPASPSVVALPPSSGLPVTDVDKEFASSTDGTTAVFSAGQSAISRDIYLVQAAGPATNLTQDAGEYEDVSYRDMVDGGSLALAPDASRVTYVRTVGGFTDIYTRDVALTGLPEKLTGDLFFEDTIEQDIGIWMVSPTKVRFHAGVTGLDQDVYKFDVGSAIPAPVTTINVTGSSGVMAPPFDVGATLSADHMARVAGNGVAYLMDGGSSPTPAKTLTWFRDAATGDTLVLQGITAWIAALPTTQGPLVAMDTTAGPVVSRLDLVGAITTPFTAAAGQSITGLVGDISATQAIVLHQQGPSNGAAVLPASGTSIAVTGLAGDALMRNAAFTSTGTALTTDSSGRIFSIDTQSGVATQIGLTTNQLIFL